jgi:hypothetical protein
LEKFKAILLNGVCCTFAYLIHLIFCGVERHISYVDSCGVLQTRLKLFLIAIKSTIPVKMPNKNFQREYRVLYEFCNHNNEKRLSKTYLYAEISGFNCLKSCDMASPRPLRAFINYSMLFRSDPSKIIK